MPSRRWILPLALGVLVWGTLGALPTASAGTRASAHATGSARAKHDGIRTVLPLPGDADSLAAGRSDVVYASYVPKGARDKQVVVRLNTATGSHRRSAQLRGGSRVTRQLAFAGPSLWVAGGRRGKHGSRLLYRLNARTLHVRDRVHLSATPSGLVATPFGIWVSEGRRLLLLDPSSGRLRRSVRLPGVIRHLAASPNGARLYAATSRPVRHDSPPLLELNSATGVVLVSSHAGIAELRGPSGLAATDSGVWVTAPTGMMAEVLLLRESDLAHAASFRRGSSNAVRASVAGLFLWVNDANGYRCADAGNGKVLGEVGTRRSGLDGNVVAVPNGFYTGGEGIHRISLRRACH